jgi:hypothetical protein
MVVNFFYIVFISFLFFIFRFSLFFIFIFCFVFIFYLSFFNSSFFAFLIASLVLCTYGSMQITGNATYIGRKKDVLTTITFLYALQGRLVVTYTK